MNTNKYGRWTPFENMIHPEEYWVENPKPGLDWLLLLVLTLDLGVWVGLLAWWIWR